MIDVLAHAGPEPIDPSFVAGYDQNQGCPDPAEDVEDAMKICADRADPVPVASVEEILRAAATSGMRVVEAQARRLRGLMRADPKDLRQSLRLFEEMGPSGTGPKLARARPPYR